MTEGKEVVNQPSPMPTRKFTAGATTALVLVIVSWIDDKYLGNQMPETVENAAVLLGFSAAAYLTKNRRV